MSRHNSPEEKKRWKQAAEAEGVPLTEFGRLAMNDRADKVLDPMRGVVKSLVVAGGSAIIKGLLQSQDKVCQCGHSRRDHLGISSGERNGSCGRATCDCRRFVEGRKEAGGA